MAGEVFPCQGIQDNARSIDAVLRDVARIRDEATRAEGQDPVGRRDAMGSLPSRSLQNPRHNGGTTDVARRQAEHEADAGPPLTLLAAVPGDRAEETRRPPRVRDARLSGEDFRPSRDVQSFLGWADLTRENPPRLLPNRLVTDDDQITPTNTPVRQMSDCDT